MSRSTASTDIFQAIADPTRRAILDRLQRGEQPVKHLAEPFAMSLPAILKRRLTSIFKIPELPNQLVLLVATKIT